MPDDPIQNPIQPPLARPAMRPANPAGPVRPAERKASARRVASVARRWFRETFSREQLLSSLRSLVWVAPLTVLIWIYAEREQVNFQAVQFPLEVRSSEPGQVAHLADPSRATVSATIRGPKARVGQAVEALQAGGPVQIYVGGGRQPGDSDVEIASLIERDPRLDGLSVISCEPKLVKVKVDALQDELLDVRVKPDDLRLFNSPPVFEPPKVHVSLPASALQAAPKGSVYAEADLPQELRTPGRHGPVSVRIKVAGLTGPDVTLRQSNVMATVDVRDADERLELKSVPVRMIITQETADAYKVTYTPKFDLSVPVYGPPDKIRQLRNGELEVKPEALFSVTSADATGRKITRKLEYVLPEGITMREGDKKSATFELTARDGAQ